MLPTIVFRLKSASGRAPATSGIGARLVHEGQAIRVYSPGGRTAASVSPPRNTFAVRLSSVPEADQLLQELKRDPMVERAYGAPPRYPAARHTTERSGNESNTGLNLAWRDLVQLPAAQKLANWLRSDRIEVAVVDSGVDTHHAALAHITLQDHVTATAPNLDPTAHGTHVTGLLAALNNGGWSSEGVAAAAASVTVHRGLISDYDPASYYRALDSACQTARVVNLSLSGSEEDEEETETIADAIARGVVIVAAAGNENEFGPVTPYPASLNDVIGVAAVDDFGRVASFSNRGSHVFIAAPGIDVGSTAPTYPVKSVSVCPGSPAGTNMSGTSMSCPIVAGVVARILALHPKFSLADVKGALRGHKHGNTADEVGLGVVDAAESLAHL